VGTGTKEDESSNGHIWAAGFHHIPACSRLAHISSYYGLFLLGAHFEIYELFISLIFQFFFSGHGKLWITETADTESADTGHNHITLF
jgi:hypothetical protein